MITPQPLPLCSFHICKYFFDNSVICFSSVQATSLFISTKHNSDSHTHIYLFSCHMQNTIRLLCIDCEP